MPKESDVVAVDPALLAEAPSTAKTLGSDATFAEKLEESPILSLIIGAFGFTYLAMYFMKNGFNMNINTVNLIFFTAGIVLHKTPMSYMRAVTTPLVVRQVFLSNSRCMQLFRS